jgi:iron complex outermembrane receptor protein
VTRRTWQPCCLLVLGAWLVASVGLAQTAPPDAASAVDPQATAVDPQATAVDPQARETAPDGVAQPPAVRTALEAGIDEIVVNAQGRDQALEEVPVSITAFSASDIEGSRMDGLQDYLRLTPNVSFATNGNRARSQISIRGVGNLGGRSNAFGVYVDGFNIAPSSSIRTFDPNLTDIERIEILRGPQGTFFGRNTTGGAISLTSKKPGPDFEAVLEGDYGRYNSGLMRSSINLPLLENQLAVRTSGYFEHTDGFVKNLGPDKGSEFNAGGLRTGVRYTPNERLTLDLSGRYTRHEQGANDYVLRDVDRGVPSRPWQISTNAREHTSIEGFVLTNHAHYELDGGGLTSITGYIENDYREVSDRDQSAALRDVQDAATELRSFSQELRFDTTLYDRVTLITGGIYAWDHLDSGSVRTQGAVRRSETGQTEETRSWAGFADAVWALHPRVDLTLGGRYTHVDYVREDRSVLPAPTPLASSRGSVSESDFSYRAVLTTRWTDSFLTYLSNTTGYKNGGSNGLIGNFPPSFEREKLMSFEAGLKTRFWDGRLQSSAAVFYYIWDDLQLFALGTLPGDPTQRSFIQNASEARTVGAEFELSAVPLEGLELSFGAGYLHAQFVEFDEAAGGDLSRETLPFSPKWTLNASAQYTYPLQVLPRFGEVDAFLRTEWSYVDEIFQPIASLAASRDNMIPSYHVLNLSAGFESDRFRVVGYVENLLGQNYFTGIRSSFLGVGAPARVDPHPRIYGVRVTMKF